MFLEKMEAFFQKKQEAKGEKFKVAAWLDSAAKRASKVRIATHVLKFTHADAKNGTDIFLKQKNEPSLGYLSSSTLPELKLDLVAKEGAKDMDVVSFLSIEAGGVFLFDVIAQDDSSVFAPFVKDEAQLSSWMKGFKSIFLEQKLSSHTLAKQVYFPIEDGKYHLLAPLFPSSLSQALHEMVVEARFGEKAKVARECKKKREMCGDMVVDYPDLAIQVFGGTQPQNISRLNTVRAGKSYLLGSIPPTWKTTKKPPIKKGVFWREYRSAVRNDVKDFKEFLLRVSDSNNIDIRMRRESYVKLLLDWLVVSAANIQSMTPGWSSVAETPPHEQLWLDPHREDFQELRAHSNWQIEVSKQFASWLIQQLKHDELKFSDDDHRELTGECYAVLKEMD